MNISWVGGGPGTVALSVLTTDTAGHPKDELHEEPVVKTQDPMTFGR